jgi:dipeptidyl aminopeptidase/acylaminoacyl peptidase
MKKILIRDQKMKKFLAVLLIVLLAFISWQHQTIIRIYQGVISYITNRNHTDFYQLTNNNSIQDISERLSKDLSIPVELRQPLIEKKRRIYIFKYLSDGYEVAGYLSLITTGEHPLVMFLRGGNGNFGILRPNNTFSFLERYNVIGTLYRGNIYKGIDEFGGEDINDIENLIRFIPKLEKLSQSRLKPPTAMIGVSRGAMQMFASLSRSELVKANVHKAISLSGNVDLNTTVELRPEMKHMFEAKFKEQKTFNNFHEWLNARNPVSLVKQLKPSLEVLLIYGVNDNRVDIKEQLYLYNALERNNIKTKFIKIPGAGHGMEGSIEEVKKVILGFLQTP